MKRQIELLHEAPWSALIILDACRADALAARVQGVTTVRSPAWITYTWIGIFAAQFGRERMLYVTANPVVNRELARCEHDFALLSVWKGGWGRWGPHRLPTVHPKDVNIAVRDYLHTHGQPRRMVIHYVQPHVPYIGAGSIPYSGWGQGMADELSRAARQLPSVEDALDRCLVTTEQVCRAYAGNVALVLPWALSLIGRLQGTVVLTADHGELLGEPMPDGAPGYGHAQPHPKLHQVPWRVWENPPHGGFSPRPVLDPAEGEDGSVRDKLRQLGYM